MSTDDTPKAAFQYVTITLAKLRLRCASVSEYEVIHVDSYSTMSAIIDSLKNNLFLGEKTADCLL